MLWMPKVVAKKYFLKKMPPFCGQKKHLEKIGHKTVAKFSFWYNVPQKRLWKRKGYKWLIMPTSVRGSSIMASFLGSRGIINHQVLKLVQSQYFFNCYVRIDSVELYFARQRKGLIILFLKQLRPFLHGFFSSSCCSCFHLNPCFTHKTIHHNISCSCNFV